MMTEIKTIEVRGASEHNLKDLDLSIDRGQITVITGVSGSGKSSLAFDTILAESQRRFFYTLSHYSRQFLDMQSRPSVRFISGLSPAISLAQNETQPSRRATVGTLTDISELLGVLYARFGRQHCPNHRLATGSMTAETIAEKMLLEFDGQTVAICTPVAESKKGTFRSQLTSFSQKGYLRAYVDGRIESLANIPKLEREEKHTIKVVIDYIKVKASGRARLVRSIETAIDEGDGHGEYYEADKSGALDLDAGGRFSTVGGCPQCGYSWPRLDSRYFSANSLGRCQSCNGYGFELTDEDHGDDALSDNVNDLERTGQILPCGACGGTGLSPKFDSITLGGKTARQLHSMPVADLGDFLTSLCKSSEGDNPAFERVADEIIGAIRRVVDVGLPYLSVARRVRSLSGGEAQRLKLAGILSENLRGVLYVLDEPSQGLHPVEIEAIWRALLKLKEAGNTVLIVDHDETFMKRADWIVDLGPGGGSRGGRLMAKFRPKDASRFVNQSLTAAFLAGQRSCPKLPRRHMADRHCLTLKAPCLHNLKMEQVDFALARFNVVTGVSGAGKSSLVLSTLYPNLLRSLELRGKAGQRGNVEPWFCGSFDGADAVENVCLVDRRPVAKSSVSMPATYLGVFTTLREIYASLPDAQVAGLAPRSFSLNVEGGRCLECKGRGEISLSMRFLADARTRCPVCHGRRYRSTVLEIRFGGLSIADVLELTLDEAADHFRNHRKIFQRLQPALDLGLGYLKLGQPTISLSGGEAQRLKLVPFLTRRNVQGQVLILDEPTTGLHCEDVGRLLEVLHKLVEEGATVITIEHHRDVIASADWVIDIGPGPASQGGHLLYQGEPKGLVSTTHSVTARYLL